MSVKSGWQELYVGKTEANIIGFVGHKTKIQYSELSKIEYSYFRIGMGGGYLRFIDKNRKTKEFSFNHKNNEQITRTIDFIAENNPNLEIIQHDAKDLKFYQRTWFIILLMFCCCFPLGLFLMWYYRKLPKSMMILTTAFFIVMYSLGICVGYQNYTVFKNNWNTAVEQIYSAGHAQEPTPLLPTTEMTTAADQATSKVENNIENSEPTAVNSEATLGQNNATKKAEEYLNYMAFSRDGLVNQLEYDGFTADEASFAADNCGADWDEQATEKAKEYLKYMAFSRDELVDQLVYDEFTNDQAEHAASAVGY